MKARHMSLRFETMLFAALATVTTVTLGTLLHAAFNIQVIA